MDSLKRLEEQESRCPVKLGDLTFEVFGTYLVTLRRLDGQYCLVSSYEGKRSSLVFLYSKAGFQMDNMFYFQLGQVLAGMKWLIADKDQRGGRQAQLGMNPLTLDGFWILCSWLNADPSRDYIFAHCFLTLAWSLMARTEATG